MRTSFAALLVLALGSAGCARACDKLWARSIANATEDDLRAMLAALAIKERVSCNTPTAIRRSRCLVRFDASEHDTLVARLALAPAPIVKSYEDGKVTCDAWREGRAIEHHRTGEPLPNVGAELKQPYRGFDLFWDTKSGESCIELQIAYG